MISADDVWFEESKVGKDDKLYVLISGQVTIEDSQMILPEQVEEAQFDLVMFHKNHIINQIFLVIYGDIWTEVETILSGMERGSLDPEAVHQKLLELKKNLLSGWDTSSPFRWEVSDGK